MMTTSCPSAWPLQLTSGAPAQALVVDSWPRESRIWSASNELTLLSQLASPWMGGTSSVGAGLGVGDGVGEGVAVGGRVCDGVGVGDGVGLSVGAGVGPCVGVGDGVGVGLWVGVGDGDGVGVVTRPQELPT